MYYIVSCKQLLAPCIIRNTFTQLRDIFRSCKVTEFKFSKRDSRVDLHQPKMLILHFHTPKMLIIQFHTSNAWGNASDTFFIQFQKIIEKRFEVEKNGFHKFSIYESCMTSIFCMTSNIEIFPKSFFFNHNLRKPWF